VKPERILDTVPGAGGRRRRKDALRRFVVRWELTWYVLTAVLYAAALVLVVLVFPDVSNVWVAVFVLLGGLTASIGTLISAIKTRAPEERPAAGEPRGQDLDQNEGS